MSHADSESKSKSKTKVKTKRTAARHKTADPGLSALLERMHSERLSLPVTQEHITPATTPMGANLIADGATFRVWAPNEAVDVYIRLSDRPDAINAAGDTWQPTPDRKLLRNSDNTWTGSRMEITIASILPDVVHNPTSVTLMRANWNSMVIPIAIA